MRKLGVLLVSVLVISVLAGCAASGEASKDETVTLKVGAASVPHAQVLEYLADDIAKEGVKLEISILKDAVQTNQHTADGELDFNYFQHIPFLEQTNKESHLDLVSVKGIHIEPFGVYSKTIDHIDDLPHNAKVAVPNDVVNFSRALLLFESNGLIELDDAKQNDFTVEDITKNEKNIQFIGVDSLFLVRSLDDVDASAINTNYALEGGYNPVKDALIIEDSQSPYVNIIATTKDKKDDAAIQKVVKWLTSDKARQFFEEQYKGAVVPAF
ncbi:MetQ/NlpA family ABC transporter substrate-binding protein [Lysinibacillus parviboronicapiens]|uniref:Lipoprotein n=1 Tax=Lysinibacillus parviboronicapiens TaxID=436516 RepID=A0ABV2PNH9_9BACI|nr:MetQ/NlpA family ABC transporter substrate-binding protein [Lysinibacillus parviboronicapiens]